MSNHTESETQASRWSHYFYWALKRCKATLRDSVACALAAVLAWFLSTLLWGHTVPTFAAVTAVVCLAPGVPSHLKQTWSLLLGCTLGIVVGELSWLLPEHHPMLRLGLSLLIALLAASLLGNAPVVPIQAGVSTLLVLAMGPTVAGEVRLLDVLTGAVVGVFFSQVLFTSDPVVDMSKAAARLLRQLGQGLKKTTAAVTQTNVQSAEQALAQVTKAHEGLAALQTAVGQAQTTLKWSLRGRLNAERLAQVMRRYDRHAVRLYASSLLLSESLVRTLAHETQAMPTQVQAKCLWLTKAMLALTLEEDLMVLQGAAEVSRLTEPWPSAQDNALPPAWDVIDGQCNQVHDALLALLAE